MDDDLFESNHDLIRWYWRDGPGRFDLVSRKPGDPPLVVSGRQLREAMQRTMTQAEWRKFREGVFARIYSGGPDAINRALRGQRAARATAAAMSTTTTPKERHEMTKPKLSRAEVIRQQLKALQEEAAHLARFPEDNFLEHTVLMTWKTYTKEVPTQGAPLANPSVYQWVTEKRDFTYTYVLLKANGQWWMTGTNGHGINGATWDRVIEFVDEDDMIDVRTGKSVMLDAKVDAAERVCAQCGAEGVPHDIKCPTLRRDPVDEVAAKADTPKPKPKGDPLMDVGY